MTIFTMVPFPQMASVTPNPDQKTPSYSLLGILLAIRLMYRLHSLIPWVLPTSRTLHKASQNPTLSSATNEQHASSSGQIKYIDSTLVHTLVPRGLVVAASSDGEDGKEFWGDRTFLDVESLSAETRAGRRCALCLEERTASTVTECGHVFCWTCIVGWGQEKVGNPFARSQVKKI
jgi:peroxin-10